MLANLTVKLTKRVDRLIAEATVLASQAELNIEQRRQAEHIVYQLQNAWEHFVREFVLLSATGRASDNDGKVVSTLTQRMRSKEIASHVLITRYPRKKTEPDWYKPADAIDAASRLQISNLAKFSAGVGSTPWPLDDLRFTRNFFAHRSKRSAIEVRNLTWFNAAARINVETTAFTYATSGVRRVEHWGSFMKVVAASIL